MTFIIYAQCVSNLEIPKQYLGTRNQRALTGSQNPTNISKQLYYNSIVTRISKSVL